VKRRYVGTRGDDRFETLPGKQEQVDWTKIKNNSGKKRCIFPFLGYGRKEHCEFTGEKGSKTISRLPYLQYPHFNYYFLKNVKHFFIFYHGFSNFKIPYSSVKWKCVIESWGIDESSTH